MSNKRNVLAVISGPSGVGKGTVIKRMFELCPDLCESVSCTTRAPREGEVNGREYFFITKQRFEEMIAQGELLEYSAHFENYYGTPRAFVEKMLLSRDVILEIDVDGALNVKKAYPDAVLVMIAPPDRQTLLTRLRGRGTEDEEVIERRVQRADYELSKSPQYDYVIINDDLGKAVGQVIQILEKGDIKK